MRGPLRCGCEPSSLGPVQRNRSGDAPMAKSTTQTPTPLEEQAAWAAERLQTWWVRLQAAHPDVAAAVTASEEMDVKEFVQAVTPGEQLSSLMCEAAPDGAVTWRCSRATRRLAELVLYVLHPRLDEALRARLALHLDHGVMDGNRSHVEFAVRVAEAAATWSAAELEARLGMTLREAYSQAGVIPIWATLPEWCDDKNLRPARRQQRTWEIRMRLCEPGHFIENCLDGLGDSGGFWEVYVQRLFGVVPL